ncbi:hypothetical protein D3C77_172390 [compost metagenome]
MLSFFLFNINANAEIRIGKDQTTNNYFIYGDIYRGRIGLTSSKNSIPNSRNMNWPAKSGIYLFVTYKSLYGDPFNPTLLRDKNLDPSSENERDILARILDQHGTLLRYYIRDIDDTALDSVSVLVCDYKVNKPTWRCDGAEEGDGQIVAPPPVEPPLACSISNAIDLRHGSVSMEALDGNRAITTAYVSCNRRATVNVAVAPNTQGRVQLSGISGLHSELSVNGKGGGNAVSISASTVSQPLIIQSVLRTDGAITAGAFRGSSYALLSIP